MANSTVDYHTDYKSISNSMIADFLASRRLFEGRYILRTIPRMVASKPMEMGNIIHAVLLDQRPLHSVVAIYPDECLKSNGAINPKPSRQFEQDSKASGIEFCVKRSQYEHVRAVTNEARRHPSYSEFIDNPNCLREHELRWINCFGQHCRCKVDFLLIGKECCYAFDLKVTAFHRPKSWNRYVEKESRIQTQVAHYSDGILSNFDAPKVEWRWLTVCPDDPVTPGSVMLHKLTESSHDRISKVYFDLMATIATCYDNSDFADVGENEENEVDISNWSLEWEG